MLYLDLVADYRLAKSVKDEIASFLKGIVSLYSFLLSLSKFHIPYWFLILVPSTS